MSTKTVQTPYGDTTIDVVECDSCGAEVAKDDALEFTLGDRTGWACEHCYDNGPISFPEKVTEWTTPTDASGRNPAAYIALYPIFVFFVALDSMYEDNDLFANGYTVGVIATLLWVAVPLLVYVAL
jgi:hypothetical protein